MAKTLSKSGIVTGADILAGHVTQSVDAFTGIDAYDITVSGSLTVDGSLLLQGTLDTNQDFVLTYNTSSGQVYYTASSAIGGGGGGITPGQTGSFMITGSVSGSTLTFTKGDSSTFDLVLDPTSSAVLTQDLLSNQNVGGVDSGDLFTSGSSLESVLRAILITAIPASLSSLALKNGAASVSVGVKEAYDDIVFNTASFSAGADNPGGLFPYSASFTASGADSGDFNIYFGDDVLGSSNNFGVGGTQTISVTSISGNSQTVTFSVRGKNPGDLANLSTSATATYVYPFYYGSSTTDFSTTGNVDGTLTKLVATKSNKTLNYNFTNEFAYICYPAIYGDLTSIKDGNGFEVLSAFTKFTRNQAGSAGWSAISYNIYKTATTSIPNQDYVFTF